MESKEVEYCWFCNIKPDPFDKSQDPQWAPYDLAINSFMEENYQKGIYRFEVDIGEDTFIMDLKENFQYLKIDRYRQRPIIRARSDEDINIHRKNRFTNFTSGTIANNNLTKFENKNNLQKKLKVWQILGYERMDKKSEIDDLLNQEILVSRKICDELQSEFRKDPTRTEFNKEAEIVFYIAEEITKQAERFSKMDKNNKVKSTLENIKSSDYVKNAKIYKEKLEKLVMPLCEKLIYMYTLEGFLVYSVNSILREGTVEHFSLHLYFILLQASIAIVSRKFNRIISWKALVKIDEKDYYKLYRGAKISESILLEDNESQSKHGSGRFVVYNEFLSTSRDQKLAERFLKDGDLKGDQVRILYSILIPKKEADANRNLMCFIEEISYFRKELEVLISSSTIFQIQKIEKKQIKEVENDFTFNIDYYDVSLMFISNGFNKFDFIKYSSLTNINLMNNYLGAEGAQGIAESLKINKTLKSINLSSNQIRYKEVQVIAESFKVNQTLTTISFGVNQIGNLGAKAIAEYLNENKTLKEIYLNNNEIGDLGAKAIAGSLKENNSLKRISLLANTIGDMGAKAIAESLKENKTLTEIILENNQIGAEGAQAIAESLKENETITRIGLWLNQIGDKGALAIAESLKVNKTLTWISLCDNHIGDQGAQAIEESLKGNKTLTWISLGFDQIDGSLKHNIRKDKRIFI